MGTVALAGVLAVVDGALPRAGGCGGWREEGVDGKEEGAEGSRR
jgi:hypothetical protein